MKKRIIVLYIIGICCAAIAQSWPLIPINTTIVPKDAWYFKGTNTYFNSFNIGGVTGTNGYIIWNGIKYDNPWTFGGIQDVLYSEGNSNYVTFNDNILKIFFNTNYSTTGPPGTNNLTISGRTKGSTNVVDYDSINKILFYPNSGFYISNKSPGEVQIELGSSWYTLYLDDGNTNGYTPTGEQPINLIMNTNPAVSNITMDVTTNPWIPGEPLWTLKIPAISGPQGLRGLTGPRGADGNTFGVYAGAWTLGREYTNSSWVTWGLGTYGLVLTNKPGNVWTPTSGVPTNYIASGEVVLLSQSGKDGASGGILIPRGTWNSSDTYPQFSLVRYSGATWYNIDESQGKNPTNPVSGWKLFTLDGKDGVDGTEAIITSNTIWHGKYTNNIPYVSNGIVYLDSPSYGVYYVKQDTPAGTPLTDTNYYGKIAHFGKDGAPGKDGKDGKDGQQGADGAGNLWFAGDYNSNHVYTNKGTIVLYKGSTWVTITDATFSNVSPDHLDGYIYWGTAARAGADGKDGQPGGNYKFKVGWTDSEIYDPYDIVIVSNKFYLCNSTISGPNTEPWKIGEPIWTALVDPDFREYALLPTTQWNITTNYVLNQVVRHSNSTWVCIAPGGVTASEPYVGSAAWAPIALAGAVGPTGPTGATSTITIVQPTLTGAPGTDANVDTTGSTPTAARLRFTIPRGQDGVMLTPHGIWQSNYPYTQYSMVKRGTNAYYTTNALGSINEDPLTHSNVWIYFLSDGARGPTGIAATVTAGNTYTIDYNKNAIVSNRGTASSAIFDFYIPMGEKGDPGANLFPYGDWDETYPYPGYSLVRRGTAQYYTINSSIGQDPLIYTNVWKIFTKDGPQGIPGSASNATLLTYNNEDLPQRWKLNEHTFIVDTNSKSIRSKSSTTTNITVKGLTNPIGSYTNGMVIPEETDFETILINMMQRRIFPTYIAPTIVLSTAPASIYNLEIGTLVSSTLTTTFTTNDAGQVSNYKLYKDNSILVNSGSIVSHNDSFTLGSNSVSYTSTVTHLQGSVKYDNFDEPSPYPGAFPDPNGGYSAGTVVSAPRTYIPRRYYWAFYDISTNLITTSAELRAKSPAALLTTSTLTFTMNITAGSKRVIIAFPKSFGNIQSIIYLQGSSADVKDTFEQTEFEVEGASAGFSTLYRIYTYIPKIPFSSMATYTVTIN